MENSRTKNTIRNMRTGVVVQLINKIMAFVVRAVFISILNTEYLGVNGLFSNILTMLSFAELGIGTAIIYNMYKPVAKEDTEKIKSLMKLYKKCYNVIGVVIFLAGLCVIPFMQFIIKEVPNIQENIIFIYVLFLVNTASSYFFTYKKSIISAHQQENIINKYNSIFHLIRSLLEIVFLLITKNYIVYLLIQIIITMLENAILARKATKMFPYLKDKEVTKLEKKETQGIFKNVKSLVIYKLGSTIMDGTDNIIISSMIDVSIVGLCSNYILIINSIKMIIQSALNGVTASLGNLNAVGDRNRKEQIFDEFFFLVFWIYTFCSISFIVLLDPFIKLWLGPEFLLEFPVIIALSVNFFITGIRHPAYLYRITLGLFKKGKMAPYIGAITNIVFSIILCKYLGLVGVFIGTCIAQLVSYTWIDPYLIYKHEFKTSIRPYIRKYIIYSMVFIGSATVCVFISNIIKVTGLLELILNGMIALIIPNIIILVLFRNTSEFKAMKTRLISIWNKKMKK